MIDFFRKLPATGTHVRGVSLPGMGAELNRLFAAPTGFHPDHVQGYLQSKADALQTVKDCSPSIEERGLAAGWLRFSAMFDRLLPMLQATATPPGELDDLWTPLALEGIDRDTRSVLKQQPRYAALLTDEARRWWQIDPMSHGVPEAPLTRDEMRTLVMHTHARHGFFELHNFAQRATRSGLSGLASRFAPQLSALRGAHQKLVLNGFGVELTTRKALRDGDETDLLLHRLKHQASVYMPLSSWGDTSYCFEDRHGYSRVLESRTQAVDVTPLGAAFLHDARASEYREYLVAEGQLALVAVDKDVVTGLCSRTALGKDVDVFKVKRLPGGAPKH